MHIQPGRLVSLGYGRFVRSDEVLAIEPVTVDRGPRRRALVWVRGVSLPLVASRSEAAIAAELVSADRNDVRTRSARALLRQLSEALGESREELAA